MQRVLNYFNPLLRLGIKKYSIRLPVAVNFIVTLLSEVVALYVLHNPLAVGSYIIFLNITLIVYFSFRDGLKGGFISTSFAILYYLYIIETRAYRGSELEIAIEATFVLMLLYLILGFTIGWLKQRIDDLIIQETEARQLAEEGKAMMETILEQLPVGVLMMNGKDKKIEKNRQIERMFGNFVRSRMVDDGKYKSPYSFKDGKPILAKDWPLARAMYNGEIIVGEEIEFKRENIHYFLRINAAPIKNKQNEIVAAVSTVDDITAEKELEQRKDDFVSMASHELKTPITSMKIYIEVLLNFCKKYQDQKAEKTLLSIKNQTEKLQNLVSDLLDVTKIQTGKLSLNKEMFDLSELISEIVDVMQGTTQQKIILTNHKEMKVYADKFRIYQVVTNLLTNAIKYSPQGKNIWINITEEKHRYLVSVKDEGIGINKTQQKKIFERLYQINESKEKTFPGLGMGLYISKEIIKRHQGNIWVEGETGKGSTFYFTLPKG
jgi:signal transduction histidine kinase